MCALQSWWQLSTSWDRGVCSTKLATDACILWQSCLLQCRGAGGWAVSEGVYLIKRLSNHGDLVALVGGLCKALEGGGLHHSLTEGHHRVSNLDLHLSIQLTQILQAVTPSSCVSEKATLACADTQQEACGLFFYPKGIVFPLSSCMSCNCMRTWVSNLKCVHTSIQIPDTYWLPICTLCVGHDCIVGLWSMAAQTHRFDEYI